jgi:hypothetical protein
MQTCHDCSEEFESWVELAQHIVLQKTTHTRSSRVWALTFLAKKDNVQEFKPRSPMSEETRQIIRECKRELSGRMETARTVCPNCKQVTEQKLEVEYIQDSEAWRNSLGSLITTCENCKRIK